MNFNPRHIGAITIVLSLALSGCTPTNQASLNAQGDLQAALRQALIGKTQDARTWVDRAIKADPNDVNVYVEKPDSNGTQADYSIAVVFSAVNDSPSLVLYMRKAVQQFPSSYAALGVLVDSEQTIGDTVNTQKDATALINLLQAQLLLPSNSSDLESLSMSLANAYFAAGNSAQAYQTLHNLINIHPTDPDPYNVLAYNCAVINDKPHMQEALVDATKALSLTKAASPSDDESIANIQDTVAWVQYRLGDYADAEENSESAVSLSPEVPEIRYHLAMIYQALGQTDNAKVEIAHALFLNPAYADAITANQQINNAPPVSASKTAMAAGASPAVQVQ